MVKFRDILEGTKFEDRINLLVDDSKNKWLRDLGKNDFVHSNNIENHLNLMVPDAIKNNEKIFDKAEIFLLLYAVYLHDIGRSTNENSHEYETYNKILNNPDEFGLKNKFEANAVAEICYGHAKESEKPISSIRTDYGIAGLSNKPLNLRFLAALLRLADEVDNAYTRVQGVKGQDNNIRNLIRFIHFDNFRWIIEFQTEPVTWKDWIELKRIRRYTQKRLDEIKDILESKGLLYYQIWLDPEDFKKIDTPIPEDIEQEELKRFIGDILSDEPIFDKECCGHIIDIYFEEKLKGLIYRNAVYVNTKIDEDTLFGYNEIFKKLKSNNRIEQGFIVIEKISDEIDKLAIAERFKIITIHQLIENFANFNNYLERYINLYQDTPIFKKDCYIPLTATLETKENVGKIDEYLDKWLQSETQLQLTILGDYGTGKSTISKRIAYIQAKKYLDNPTNERIPLLIELKNYQKSISIESLITDLLINKYSIGIKNFNAFKHLNESGKLLIILDGFDEMASRVDYKTILSNFREFDKLISESSKMILTCRTHYFKNQDEILKLHEGTKFYKKIDNKSGYTFLFLNPFNESDFIIYLKKFFQKNWKQYYQAIVDTYNLRELAEKPILLELMVETLPQIKIEKNEKLNHASLYDIYTNFWLQRDDWRSYLSIDEREFITEEIAFYLFINKKEEIFYEELPELIHEKFLRRRNFEIEYLDQDVRTCTFLNRDDRGYFSFVHKSFMEFFIAKKIANNIKNKNNVNLRLKKFTIEIVYFLINLIEFDDIKTLGEFIKFTKDKSFEEVGYLGGNSATIINLFGSDFNEMDMSNTVLIGANFNNAELIKTNLSYAMLGGERDFNEKIVLIKSSASNTKTTMIDASTDIETLRESIENTLNEIMGVKVKLLLRDPRLKEIHSYIKKLYDKKLRVSCISEEELRGFVDKYFLFEPIVEFEGNYEVIEPKRNPLTTFIRANLTGANLNNADLTYVDLTEAKLIGAKLIGTKLNKTTIIGAIR